MSLCLHLMCSKLTGVIIIIIIIIIIMKAKIIVKLYIKNLQGHFTQLIITKARCQCQ